jgi:hypothetical protein
MNKYNDMQFKEFYQLFVENINYFRVLHESSENIPLPIENEPFTAIVYHGGKLQIAKDLKASKEGALGAGYYFTTRENAARYAKESGSTFQKHKNGMVHKYQVNLRKPLIIDIRQGHIMPEVIAFIKLGMDEKKANQLSEKIQEEKGYPTKEISSRAIKFGYDGIVYINSFGEVMEIVAWNSNSFTALG